jgi:hypothetical protein
MTLVFGSEVALLGFWEYMFQILFRVYQAKAAEVPTVPDPLILIQILQLYRAIFS